MPKHIKNTTTGQEMRVYYAFDGEKVRTVAPQGERIYLGGMEYLAGAKQHYTHAEGRMTYEVDHNVEKSFIQYKIADHLGNMMVLFGDRDGDRHLNTETDVAATDDGNPNTPPTVQLEIVQRHFYYAYGMEMEGPWQLMPTMRDAYMYNDKELLLDLGMDLSDYGARYYDAVIGRWTGVDPLAEKYYGWSGYNYVLGNPIGLIDPTGMSAEGGPGGPSRGPGPQSDEEENDKVLPEVVIIAPKPNPRPTPDIPQVQCQSCGKEKISTNGGGGSGTSVGDSRIAAGQIYRNVSNWGSRTIGGLDKYGDRVEPFVSASNEYLRTALNKKLLYHSFTTGEGFENSLTSVRPIKSLFGPISAVKSFKAIKTLTKVGAGLTVISVASYMTDISNGETAKGYTGLAIIAGSMVGTALCPPCTFAIIGANAVYSLYLEDKIFESKKE